MNSAIKAAVSGTQRRLDFVLLRCSFFHSTPVLERKRRTRWDIRSSQFSRKFRKLQSKQTLLRNVDAYADILFQRWRDGADNDEPPQGTESWFKSYWTRGFTNERGQKQQSHRHRRSGFQFCDDDDIDVENIFKSAFGGTGFFHWSFVKDEGPRWWGNSRNHSGQYQRFDYQRRAFSDDDYDSSPESDAASSSLSTSDRLALGLKASGPLKIEDVKNAYRACALKWHPDRHQGSSKVGAEEKFKICSAAYQSLCDKLAVN